jgi:uncharacterized protein (TIGR03086 family)
MTVKAEQGPELMAAAAAETARVINNAAAAPLDAATPCTDWDLRTLLNHTILWTAYSAERRARGQSVAEELMHKDFTADPGFAGDYKEQVGRAVQAWSDPQAWEGEIGVMGSAMPRKDVGAMLIMETALHGWDIAAATGQDYNADDALAAALLSTIDAQADMFRQYKGFTEPLPAKHDATVFERALAESGRDPRWQAPSR